MEKGKPREQWGSKIGFILAAGGSAVGLGNIWKFPYVTGQYGGAAFLIVYIAVIAIIGFTVMLTEMVIGRRTQLSCAPAFAKLKKGPYRLIGATAVLIGALILSYYCVIGGWTIKYILYSFSGLMEQAGAGKAGEAFGAFISNPGQLLLYHGLFVLLTAGIVLGGVKGGIERVCKIMMPALFVIMLVMIVRAVTLSGAAKGLAFYLMPDFSKFTGAGALAAVGQAFFSLSLGMGIMITYGSYVQKDVNLPTSVMQVCVIDTAVAFLSGLVVFPAVFAFGLDVGAGPSLTFITLPSVFAKMPLSTLWSVAFFVLFFFAAVTSSMSLLEVPVAYLMDTFRLKRNSAVCLAAGAVFLVGIPSALGLSNSAFNIAGKGFLDAMDYITNNVGMPLIAALTCLFAGWLVSDQLLEELEMGGLVFKQKKLWLFSVRVICPILILVIFFNGLKW